MANARRGEVDFKVDGKTWTLRYSANALCELEDHLGKTTGEIIAAMQSPSGASMRMLRSIFWGGLIDDQPDVDVKAAGDLMTSVGVGRVSELVGDAFARAFPDVDEPAEEPDGRPRKGSEAAGTGMKS